MSSDQLRRWYGSKHWRVLARHQIRMSPLCVMCLADGRVEPATIADHIVPHHGDQRLFWFGRLQSLCAPHHSASKQRDEYLGFSTQVGEDGWPTDKNHPFYRHKLKA